MLELTIAIAIFALAASGIMSVFISSATLTDSAGFVTSMANRARQELEGAIWNRNFDNLMNYSILVGPLNRMSMVCYVQRHNSVFCQDQNNLREVRIVVTYEERQRRIIGEDRNFNGALDGGEDINGDGRLTSPCEIVTFATRRQTD